MGIRAIDSLERKWTRNMIHFEVYRITESAYFLFVFAPLSVLGFTFYIRLFLSQVFQYQDTQNTFVRM